MWPGVEKRGRKSGVKKVKPNINQLAINETTKKKKNRMKVVANEVQLKVPKVNKRIEEDGNFASIRKIRKQNTR